MEQQPKGAHVEQPKALRPCGGPHHVACGCRKSAGLPVERTQFGFVQRARFSHPDLHHEEVLELDSPFAAVVAAGTHVFSFVLLGDQNAGKSTFLHSFSCTDEPHWLELSSYLPLLSSAFLNVRLLPPGDDTPPRDELPYIDTDIGRGNFLMTAENFAFFLREFGLAPDSDARGAGAAPPLRECLGDARYVLTQFIEVGGDHLDRLIARASPAGCTVGSPASSPGWLDDTLRMSERLLRGVGRGAYYLNAATLFPSHVSPTDAGENSDTNQLVISVPALRLLLDRLSYLSRSAPTVGLELLILVSRLSPTDGAAAPIFDSAQSVKQLNAALEQLGLQQVLEQGFVAADFVFHCASDLNNLPDVDEDVELHLEIKDHPVAQFVRQLLKVVHHALGWNLRITQVLPATHHRLLPASADSTPVGTCGAQMVNETSSVSSPEAGSLVMSVSGLVGTLVRLFNGRLMDRSSQHPDSLVAAHILGCWEDVGRRVCKSNSIYQDAATSMFNPYVTAADFRDYLLDDVVEDQLELPATTILQRFEPVSRHLVSAGLCLAHAGQNHACLTVKFWHEQQHDAAASHAAGTYRHPVGEWRTWCDSESAGPAEFGIRFPYHPNFMAAIRGHFDREIPTEFWLHSSSDNEEHQPCKADPFAGVIADLEAARTDLQAEAIRSLKAFIQQLEAGMDKPVETVQGQHVHDCTVFQTRATADRLAFHLEELALLTHVLHGNSSSPCVRVSVEHGATAALQVVRWLTQSCSPPRTAAEPFSRDCSDSMRVDIMLTEKS